MNCVFNNRYMGSKEVEDNEGITIIGCPLDATSSFRGGTRFAPDSIRKASWTLETYSPYLKKDLDEMVFYDSGNLELRQGDLGYSLEIIEGTVTKLSENNRKVLIFGGEHLVTYPALKAIKKLFSDIQLIHFDAHCDLRDEYEGQKLSHATVIRRIKETGVSEIFQVGIRSGTRQEFKEAYIVDSPASLAAKLKRNVPIYLTFDMDVIDPSLACGVTTPEPGGLMFNEIMQYLSAISGFTVVCADIVELAPDYDTSFVSSVCAAKIAREILMLL